MPKPSEKLLIRAAKAAALLDYIEDTLPVIRDTAHDDERAAYCDALLARLRAGSTETTP